MVTVVYRPGREHSYMRAPGGLRYSLGTKDGLSKAFVWAKGNDHAVTMAEADAKIMQAHNDAKRLPVVREYDFLTGADLGEIPAFLIGDAAIKKHMDDFGKRYDAYNEAAQALANANSDDLFTLPEGQTQPPQA